MRISDWSSDVCSSDLLMGRAGLAGNALPLIREELATDKSLDPHIRVKLARIAQQASASRLAAEILEPAIAELDNREYQIGRASCRKECVSTCRSRWLPYH